MSFPNINLTRPFLCSKCLNGFTLKFEDGFQDSVRSATCLHIQSLCLGPSLHSFCSSQYGCLVLLRQTNVVSTLGYICLMFPQPRMFLSQISLFCPLQQSGICSCHFHKLLPQPSITFLLRSLLLYSCFIAMITL